jgi:hypothetical protein
MSLLLAAQTAKPATGGQLIFLGAAFLVMGLSVFIFPGLYDAAAKFRSRLLFRRDPTERGKRWEKIYRTLLGGSFVLFGAIMVVNGLSK